MHGSASPPPLSTRDRQRAKRAIRRLLRRLQGELCPACGSHLASSSPDQPHWGPTIDHVIPRALGGWDAPGNLLAVHLVCNRRKAHRKPTGCEIIWLLAINNRLGVKPDRM